METDKDKMTEVFQRLKNSDDQLLKGIRGFIRFTFDNNLDANKALSEILHDVCGILANEKCFSPRTSSYIDYEETPPEQIEAEEEAYHQFMGSLNERE